ncbi:MAG: class I SAM-dependent methyltransferase [Patescibacteria group bacterium]
MATKFINPSSVMAQTGLMRGEVVADLGCGNGFYVLPAAQLAGPEGEVIAVDVQESKLAATVSIANQYGYRNIKVVRADLAKPLLEIPPASCDMVILSNIMHEIGQGREMLLKNAYRILKTGGKIAVIEWKRELSPIGPPINNRLDQQAAEMVLMKAGFRKGKDLEADGYHYAVLFLK